MNTENNSSKSAGLLSSKLISFFPSKYLSSNLGNLLIIIFFMLVVAAPFFFMNFTEGDDGKFYNAFTIKAAREGVFDFSIPGFLGASILAIPVFLLTNSNFSVNYLGALCAILIIPILFLLGKKLFKTTKASVVLCSFFALSPYFYLVSLKGFTQTIGLFLVLLTILLIASNKKYSFLPWGFSIIIRPFSLCLLPFFCNKKRILQIVLAFVIAFLYIIAQLVSTGTLQIGMHGTTGSTNIFSVPSIPNNILHALQIIFSVHDFSPNMSYLGGIFHITNIIAFAAVLFVLFRKKNVFASQTTDTLFYQLLFSALLAFVLSIITTPVDVYYMDYLAVLLLLLATPVLLTSRGILFTGLIFSIFQFYYFFMEAGTTYGANTKFIFLIYMAVIIFNLWFFFIKDRSITLNQIKAVPKKIIGKLAQVCRN